MSDPQPGVPRAVMLVTGASRGIGAGISRLAAAAGYSVVVNFATSDDAASTLVQELGNDSFAVRADVSQESDILSMFAEIDSHFGRLDVLVNNAGIAGGYGMLDSYTVDALEHLWAVNLTGPFVCAREAANRMRAGSRGGSIINISSKAAVLGGPNEWVHYAASKGGIDTMTIGLAKELAPHNIRVNAVRPGLIESDFHLHATPGRLERMRPLIPMQRAGTPAEVAEAVLWLASPAASYVTGAFIEVTGGR
jgi:NAD(P)-dependent dehydrogenase (short-subunit alcohol dehydrogenase family)